jgi:hypothetical protein
MGFEEKSTTWSAWRLLMFSGISPISKKRNTHCLTVTNIFWYILSWASWFLYIFWDCLTTYHFLIHLIQQDFQNSVYLAVIVVFRCHSDPTFLSDLDERSSAKNNIEENRYASGCRFRFFEKILQHHPNIQFTCFLTLGKSRIWFASRSSSSKLLAYRMMSSGTVLRVQCLLSTYSTCRLQPFRKGGIHLNIL